MRENIGDFGHILVLLSFVTSIIGCVSFYKAASSTIEDEQRSWLRFGRINFGIHASSVVGIVIALFIIIYNHYYEYHYAWDHSSNELPIYYMISCFWEGQEGSFLLWIFWHVCIGIIFMLRKSKFEAEVFTVVMSVQVFLTSMIVGAAIGDFRLGSSPFILLKEVMLDAPIFASNPNYVPENGNGLNALLQNYWMVIHPPTLFLGFALMIIPFALAVASLWKKDFTSWMKSALPWLIADAGILGLGIMMGAYWAYETLNFGGYWNWDPVENAVYIPWLIMVAAIHTMLLFNKHKTVLKTTYVLVISAFVLVVYASFLTRSGILGDTSVHSFTDLGLTFQLATFLIVYFIFGIVIYQFRRKAIPGGEDEIKSNKTEFWILCAVVILSLTSFQVWFGTSIPVFNKVFGSNIAPPTDQVSFYSKFQIWGGIAIAIFAGIGQYLFWQKNDKETLKKLTKQFSFILLGLIVFSATVLILFSSSTGYFETAIQDIEDAGGSRTKLAFKLFSYVLLLGFSLFSLLSTTRIVARLYKSNNKTKVGGSLTHTGIALMLIGILFSSGYDKIISLNRTGFKISNNASEEFNGTNIRLERHRTSMMNKYALTYKGRLRESLDIDRYISQSEFYYSNDAFHGVARKPIIESEDTLFAIGDTFRLSPDNYYYEIKYKEEGGNEFTLYPRAQINPQMGGLLASPDVKSLWNKDLYTHVSSVLDPNEPVKWSDTTYTTVSIKDTFYINDFVAYLDTVKRIPTPPWFDRDSNAIVVKADIHVVNNYGESFLIEPMLWIRGGDFRYAPIEIADDNEDIGAVVSYMFAPSTNTKIPKFKIAVRTTPLDYVVLKVVEKPFINVLWIGTLLAFFGFGVSFWRRVKER